MRFAHGPVYRLLISGSAAACGDQAPQELDRADPTAAPWASCGDTIVGLTLSPGQSEIEVGEGRPLAEIRYQAIATLSDGRRALVPAQWSIDMPWAGSLSADGVLTASLEAGGNGLVTARARGHGASRPLAIRLIRNYRVDVSPEVPERFSGDRERRFTAAPRLLTPSGEAQLPSNREAIEVTWDRAGHDAFHLLFESSTTAVSVYTAADRYVPSEEVWRAVAYSNPGSSVRVTVEGVTTDDDRVYRTPEPIFVSFCLPEEVCNGVDDNCNDAADEACAEPPFTPGSGGCP